MGPCCLSSEAGGSPGPWWRGSSGGLDPEGARIGYGAVMQDRSWRAQPDDPSGGGEDRGWPLGPKDLGNCRDPGPGPET